MFASSSIMPLRTAAAVVKQSCISSSRSIRRFATTPQRPSFASPRPATSIPPNQGASTGASSSSSPSPKNTSKPSRTNFSRPAPPSLPAADQAEFDALLKANSSIGATPAVAAPKKVLETVDLEMHKDVRKGPKAEFEGEENPRTGERGGPKVDPFKASQGDWSYAGRVTDF